MDKMKKKQSFWRNLAIGAVAFVSGLAGVVSGANSGTLVNPVTAENLLKNDYTMRARAEQTETEDTHLTKVTTGVAPTSEKYNRFNEFWRSYHFIGEQNGKDVQWDNFGLIVPKFKTGELEHSINIYGESGDRESIGVEGIASLGKWDLFYVTEDNSTSESKRIGSGIEYGFGETWNFGAGVDRVDTPNGDINYFTGKTIWNIDKNHQTGAGAKLADNELGTNRVAAYFMRHGDVSWGNRTYVLYDWKENKDLETLTFQTIFAENPLFGKLGSGPAFVGRNQGYLLSPEVISSPVTVVESPKINERSKKGLVFGANGCITDTGERKGYVEGDLGYQFGDFGGYGFYKNGIEQPDSVGAYFSCNIGKHWRVEASKEI